MKPLDSPAMGRRSKKMNSIPMKPFDSHAIGTRNKKIDPASPGMSTRSKPMLSL